MHSLLPLLQLLATYQDMLFSTAETQLLVKALEKLLVENTILPARASFLSSKRPNIGLDNGASLTLHKDLLKPLSEAALSDTHGSPPAVTFYRAAIRSVLRKTPKERMAENLWLQSLFRQLVEDIPSTPLLHFSSYRNLVHTIKLMLQEAAHHNVLLDKNLLESLLLRFSGLLVQNSDTVDWEFISICLELNSDVFVVPSPQRKPSNLLTHLLARITDLSFDLPQDRNLKYGQILLKIIIPLVRAFAHARDLTRFIDYWKEELRRYEERPEYPDAVPSIWEDDKLCQIVADLIELTLTTGQVSQILQAALISSENRSLASLVVLNSVINGCRSDGSILELTEIVRSTNTCASELVLNESCWRTLKMWRVWRLLATINSRWPIVRATPEIEFVEQKILCRALEILGACASHHDIAEGLYAFSYILSFTTLEKSGSKILDRPAYDTIRQAIGIVMDHQETLSTSMLFKDSAVSHQTRSAPRWNGRSDGIESIEILLMVCQAQVVSSPEAFQ